MLDLLHDMFFIVLLVIGFLSSLSATLVYHRRNRQESIKKAASKAVLTAGSKMVDREIPKAKQEMSKTERAAFVAGRTDVVNGWIAWAKYPTDTEREQERKRREKLNETEEGRQKLAAMDALAKHSSRWDTGYRYGYPEHNRTDKAEQILAEVPTPKWSMKNLRDHLSSLAIYCTDGDAPTETVQTRQRLTAAMITDRLDETFDPSQTQVTAQYAYHDNHQVQARYLEGRAKGTEDIMDAITSARTRNREIGAVSNALAAANERHAAALAALRETNQPTAARDQHADYDAQVRAIETTTDPTED